MAGDANGDGRVDVGDLGILAANYGRTWGVAWAQGDFNGDGKVDVGDLGILAANYGSGVNHAVNFEADYARIFDTPARQEEPDEEVKDILCSGFGLPLLAGLLMGWLLLVSMKLKV